MHELCLFKQEQGLDLVTHCVKSCYLILKQMADCLKSFQQF